MVRGSFPPFAIYETVGSDVVLAATRGCSRAREWFLGRTKGEDVS